MGGIVHVFRNLQVRKIKGTSAISFITAVTEPLARGNGDCSGEPGKHVKLSMHDEDVETGTSKNLTSSRKILCANEMPLYLPIFVTLPHETRSDLVPTKPLCHSDRSSNPIGEF